MPYLVKDGIPQCKRSGVYCITNLRNGKLYVGSATVITARLQGHRSYLRRNKHDNSYLQRAWNKYGEQAFQFDVIETCDIGLVLEREQYWIDCFQASHRNYGYNLAPNAGGTRGYKWTEEACRRSSEARKGADTSRITALAAEANRGRKRPLEVAAKISAAHKGKKKSKEHRAAVTASHWSKREDAAEIIERTASKLRGRKHTEEHKARIAEAGRQRWKRRREGILHATTA